MTQSPKNSNAGEVPAGHSLVESPLLLTSAGSRSGHGFSGDADYLAVAAVYLELVSVPESLGAGSRRRGCS